VKKIEVTDMAEALTITARRNRTRGQPPFPKEFSARLRVVVDNKPVINALLSALKFQRNFNGRFSPAVYIDKLRAAARIFFS